MTENSQRYMEESRADTEPSWQTGQDRHGGQTDMAGNQADATWWTDRTWLEQSLSEEDNKGQRIQRQRGQSGNATRRAGNEEKLRVEKPVT